MAGKPCMLLRKELLGDDIIKLILEKQVAFKIEKRRNVCLEYTIARLLKEAYLKGKKP